MNDDTTNDDQLDDTEAHRFRRGMADADVDDTEGNRFRRGMTDAEPDDAEDDTEGHKKNFRT